MSIVLSADLSQRDPIAASKHSSCLGGSQTCVYRQAIKVVEAVRWRPWRECLLAVLGEDPLKSGHCLAGVRCP
jgi:hypothetical protein